MIIILNRNLYRWRVKEKKNTHTHLEREENERERNIKSLFIERTRLKMFVSQENLI